jgi:hypothetical protein
MPRGVLANVSAHTRTQQKQKQNAIVIIVDVIIVVDFVVIVDIDVIIDVIVEGGTKLNCLIKVLAISDKNVRHFSSSFTPISAHTNFHDPRTTPSGRKVIRRRRGGGKRKEREKKEKN